MKALLACIVVVNNMMSGGIGGGTSVDIAAAGADVEQRSGDDNVHLQGLKYVIFPDEKKAQVWDFLMILVIIFYAFYIPFHAGISAGYLTFTNDGFFAVVVSMNAVFFFDTFIAFFRAYRDENGVLIFSLRTIAKRYIRSGWFFVNLLASFPTTSILYAKYYRNGEQVTGDTLFIFELFKLLRLVRINVRIKKLLNTSETISKMYERVNLGISLTAKFVFLIVLVSHWIGCIWGFVAFYEVGHTWNKEALLSTPNWIGNWYVPDSPGLNPIGYANYMDRYWLCLFWAIQTITSIGYGNIAPLTASEFAVANCLMLCAGIFWAYVIGSLVDVVAVSSKLQNEYVTRMDEANQLVKNFKDSTLPESVTGSTTGVKASKRVRRFLTNQKDHSTKNWMDEGNSLTLSEEFPTLNLLSPELRRECALHLMHSYLETVPYLSSKYLSANDRAEIALQCRTLEFAAGEHFSSHPELGRGILIFKQGFGFSSRNLTTRSSRWTRALKGHALDVNEVLIEDEYYKEKQLVYHFINFTKVLFVPRSAIMNMLEKNPVAWKECARWRYFRAALVLESLKDTGTLMEVV
ncbi:hypothetical protein ACHAWT_006619 [Skeletonema menzelii]